MGFGSTLRRRRACSITPDGTSEELGRLTSKQLLDSRVILGRVTARCTSSSVPSIVGRSASAEKDLPARERTSARAPSAAKVVDLADLAGSTKVSSSDHRQTPRTASGPVGTEVHWSRDLAGDAAERGVSVRILSDCQCLCTTMFRIDQEHLCWVLD